MKLGLYRYGFGLVLLGIALIAGVAIGICVGLDAKSRGIKPAAVWGIVAAVAPGFIGVVGYLIVVYLDNQKKK